MGGYGFTFDRLWWPLTRAGEPTAHWSYLYTLYLVVVYGLAGIHPLLARSIQAVLVGFLMPWLVYRITQKTFENPNRGDNWNSNEIDLVRATYELEQIIVLYDWCSLDDRLRNPTNSISTWPSRIDYLDRAGSGDWGHGFAAPDLPFIGSILLDLVFVGIEP